MTEELTGLKVASVLASNLTCIAAQTCIHIMNESKIVHVVLCTVHDDAVFAESVASTI